MTTILGIESLSEKALRETCATMGKDAYLLQYLHKDKIYEKPFEDKKRERPGSLPVRILFGQLIEGDRKGDEVWILLHKSHTEDRSPEQRFNIFNRQGRLLGGITAEDAVRQTNPVNAFKFLKTSTIIPGMDMAQLHAVIKYYFMVKKVNPGLPWPVDIRFTSQLAAACKVARKSAEKAANNSQKENERKTAADTTCRKKSPITVPQDAMKTPADQSVRADTPLALTQTQSLPRRSSMRSASTQPTRSLPFGDNDSLFVPEESRPAAPLDISQPDVPTTAPAVLSSGSEPLEEFRRILQMRMLPQHASKPHTPPPSNPKSIGQLFSTHQIAGAVSKTVSPATPKPVSEDKDAQQQKEKSTNHQSPSSFVSAYRKADAESELYEAQLRDIDIKMGETKAEIAVLENRLSELEIEERRLKAKHKDTQKSKKRLHDELTSESRKLLRFGAELAEREFKRAKTGAHEHVDGDEWCIMNMLGCGQKE